MSLESIVHRTRSILFGAGLGEKPPIRIGAASAAESTSGQLITFSLASGEGAKCKLGQTLAVYDPATEADAHAVYITKISSTTSDQITGINGYMGSPVVVGSDSGDLDNALFEQNPAWTGFEIFEAIDTVIASLLWPHVFDVVTATIASPDLVHGTEAVPAEVEDIISAWQKVGSRETMVEHSIQPFEVHTDLATNGKLAKFRWINGTTGYYTYRAKFTEADEADTELTHLIALGAAAVLLGAASIETTFESAKRDNSDAVGQRGSAGDRIWRDFVTLRQSLSQDLVNRMPRRIYFNRG